jgi:hypothetical protein
MPAQRQPALRRAASAAAGTVLQQVLALAGGQDLDPEAFELVIPELPGLGSWFGSLDGAFGELGHRRARDGGCWA